MERKKLKDTRIALREPETEAQPKTETRDAGFIRKVTNTVLDEKLITDFCQLIIEGLPADSCCNYLGIHPQNYSIWMRKGMLYLNGGNEPPEFEVYALYVLNFRRATAQYLRNRTKSLHEDDNKFWFRDMEILSRRDRATWARDERPGGGDDQMDPDERFL